MSAEPQGGAGRREVAYRLFAAEFDDADVEHSEDDDERSPNYVITPTGGRVNRLFVVGVLTEVEQVNEDMLRSRIVDPTGAFVSYAGQYQPDAKTFLERAEPPQFVAMTGKARTFEPEDGDVIYTSVRPETINDVDSEVRDRWTVQTARHTIERVRTMAGALDRPERGDELRQVLEAEGVEAGFAAGIPLAIEHYGTTTGYLAALRDLAVQAAEVVAGDRDEVEALTLAPDEGGAASIPDALSIDADVSAVAGEAETETVTRTETATAAGDDEAERPEVSATPSEPDGDEAAETADADAATTADESADEGEPVEASQAADAETTEEPASEEDGLGDFDAYGDARDEEEPADATADSTTDDISEPEDGEAAETDELYELDESERAEVEEEFGTEFSTGSEVESPDEDEAAAPTTGDGAADDVDATEPDVDEAEPDVDVAEPAPDADPEEEAETDVTEPAEADESADATAEAETTDHEPPEDVDLEVVAVEAMDELDDGDGASRQVVIEAVVSEYGVDESEVEEAIEDALMSGKCYEPGDDRLKAI